MLQNRVAGINTFTNYEVDTMSIYQSSIDDALKSDNAQQVPAADIYSRVMVCAREYINRRDRICHPGGSFDSGGRFSLSEKYDCCDGIRSPSRAYPFSEMLHGRTLGHVAHEFCIEQHISVIRRIANRLTKEGEDSALELLNSKAVKRKLLEVDLDV